VIKRHLASYINYVNRHQPTSFQLEWSDALMNSRNRRLVIVAPPESGKSSWLAAFCAWAIGNDPSFHIGYIANTFRQAARQSVAVRETLRSNERYRQLFPNIELDELRGTSETEWFVKRPDAGDKDATFQVSGYGGPTLGARWT